MFAGTVGPTFDPSTKGYLPLNKEPMTRTDKIKEKTVFAMMLVVFMGFITAIFFLGGFVTQ